MVREFESQLLKDCSPTPSSPQISPSFITDAKSQDCTLAFDIRYLWSTLTTKCSMYQNGCLYKKRLYCCFSLTLNSGPTERRLEKLAEEPSCVWEFSPHHFLVRDFPAHYIQAALICKSQPTGTHQKHEFLMLWIRGWTAQRNHFFLIPLYLGKKIITSEMKIRPAFQNTISVVETMEAMKYLRCTSSGVSHCWRRQAPISSEH